VPARGPYVNGYNIRLYRATDVERFAARLLHRAVKATVLAPAQVTLPQAARVMGIPLASILIDVLDGYPVPMDLDTDLPLLQRLTLPRDEIQRYLGERERRRREELGLLTAREAAAQLGVDDGVLRLWIRRGLLPSERLDGRRKRSRLVIRREALTAFRRTYLWTEEAAEYLGIVAQTVHKYVRKGILHPVAGRRVGDGSNRLLFPREEVEALLPPGSLTVQEAARLLGVSPSRAYAIIRLGKLKSVAIPGGGSTTIRIQRGELEAYRREIGKGDIQT